ncbi:MAG: DUF4037 domain-containing protein [Candidatus Latescibacteria bacterium]|nr:DUF4037 domain-containing protein [Candidatus Latescibacterota bacterium]
MTSPTPDFVNGLELARLFYFEIIRPLLGQHPHSAARLGPGSEILGLDTPRSTDHDWGPQLHIFVADAQIEAIAATIDSSLPEQFRGWPVRFGSDRVATQHHVRVSSPEEWFTQHLGFNPQASITPQNWLSTSQQLLLEATAGAVFSDPDGILQTIRASLAWYPDDIWRWLLACQWRRLSQEEAFVGRTAEVGDEMGSRMVAARIVRDLIRLSFLLTKRYAPYNKWLGSVFDTLPIAADLAPHLHAALDAVAYPAREAALCAAYECIAHRFNALRLTTQVNPQVRLFHTRPFRVLEADRFVDACLSSIDNTWLRCQPLVGSIDQFADSTDILSNARHSDALANIYGD